MSQPHDSGKPEPDRSDDDLERLREILVGEKIRSLDANRRDLQHRLTEDLQQLKDDAARKTAALETFVREKLDSLESQLGREREARQALQEAHASLDARCQQQMDELRKALAEQSLGVRRTMTGRSDLAKLLENVAAQLSATPPDVDPPPQ